MAFEVNVTIIHHLVDLIYWLLALLWKKSSKMVQQVYSHIIEQNFLLFICCYFLVLVSDRSYLYDSKEFIGFLYFRYWFMMERVDWVPKLYISWFSLHSVCTRVTLSSHTFFTHLHGRKCWNLLASSNHMWLHQGWCSLCQMNRGIQEYQLCFFYFFGYWEKFDNGKWWSKERDLQLSIPHRSSYSQAQSYWPWGIWEYDRIKITLLSSLN